jgi:hypothetical protein
MWGKNIFFSDLLLILCRAAANQIKHTINLSYFRSEENKMRIFLAVIFFLTCTNTRAQDTIVLNSTEIIAAKVMEVSGMEIKYKRADNPDGPLYVKRLNRVKKIIYKNGKEEIIDADALLADVFMNDEMTKHVVYLEVAGNATRDITFSYEYFFKRTADYGIGARVGINPGLFERNDNPYIVFPVTPVFIFGQTAALEVGAGILIANYNEYEVCYYCYPWHNEKVNVTRVFPTGTFGFRVQKKDILFFKATVTPLFLMQRMKTPNSLVPGGDMEKVNIYTTGGLSLGYSF